MNRLKPKINDELRWLWNSVYFYLQVQIHFIHVRMISDIKMNVTVFHFSLQELFEAV